MSIFVFILQCRKDVPCIGKKSDQLEASLDERDCD